MVCLRRKNPSIAFAKMVQVGHKTQIPAFKNAKSSRAVRFQQLRRGHFQLFRLYARNKSPKTRQTYMLLPLPHALRLGLHARVHKTLLAIHAVPDSGTIE